MHEHEEDCEHEDSVMLLLGYNNDNPELHRISIVRLHADVPVNSITLPFDVAKNFFVGAAKQFTNIEEMIVKLDGMNELEREIFEVEHIINGPVEL